MKPSIVLDKNFLHGSKSTDVRALAQTHTLVMPGALFYELLTTSPDARRKCFTKLPEGDNPVELVDHIGVLLKYEQLNRVPCGKPSLHREMIRFRFNKALLDHTYQLPTPAADELRRQTLEVESDIVRFVDMSERVLALFPGLVDATKSEIATHESAEQAIARPDEIMRFYVGLESPDPMSAFPAIHESPEQWAHIRWLQVLMLFATDLFVRYQGNLRASLTANVRTKLEHDVHDAQVLVLALLEGGLATRERKLRRWFSLLKPGAGMFPPEAAPT